MPTAGAGDLDRELDELRSGLGDPAAEAVAAQLLADGATAEQELELHLLRGLALAIQYRFSEAVPELELVTEVEPASPLGSRAWNALGNIARMEGRSAEAIHSYEHALEVAPPEFEDKVRTNLANAYFARGEVLRAADAYAAIAAEASGCVPGVALSNLACLYYAHDLHVAAERSAEEALEAFEAADCPSDAVVAGAPRSQCHAIQAVVLARRGDRDAAESAWARALEAAVDEPLFARTGFEAEYLHLSGDLEAASISISDAIERWAGDEAGPAHLPRLYLQHAEILRERGDLTRAEELVEVATHLEGSGSPFFDARVLGLRSELARESGDEALALGLLQEREAKLSPWVLSQRLALASTALDESSKQDVLADLEGLLGRDSSSLGWVLPSLGALLVSGLVVLMSRRRMRRARREMLTSREEVDFRVGALAHDIRNPLQVLLGSLEMLGYDPAECEELVDAARMSAEQIREITDDCVALSRLRSTGGEVPTEAIDFVEVANESVRAWEVAASRKGIAIDAVLASAPAPVRMRQGAARRLFDNLLSNAIKYSPDGATVRVDLALRSSELELHVVDEGVGVQEEELARFFEPFARLSASPTGGEEKTGLGMAIARALVVEARGSIDVSRNAGGVGLTLAVRLPVESAEFVGA